MLSKDDMLKAIELQAKYENSGKVLLEDQEFYNRQMKLSKEFLKKMGLFNYPIGVDDKYMLQLTSFLLDEEKIKELLSYIRNKAFW